MFISDLFIKNYRKFGNEGTRFFFQNDINIIVGENNSGKSALVDALRLVLSSGLYRKKLYVEPSDFHINSYGEKATEIQIDVFFNDLSQEQQTTFYMLTDGSDMTKGEIHLKYHLFRDSKGKERIRDTIHGGPRQNQIPLEVFESFRLIFMKALRNAESDLKPARASQLAQLLSVYANGQEEKDRILGALIEANELIKSDDVIINIQNAVNKNLKLIEKEELQQEVEVNLVNPTFESLMSALDASFKVRHNRIKLSRLELNEILVIHESEYSEIQAACTRIEDDISINLDILSGLALRENLMQNILEKRKQSNFVLRQNGLGYNNILSMATVLGDLQQVNEEGLSVLIVEEPEAHLHPQLLDLLFNFFEKANNENNFQVFLTSHSPTLVSKAEIRNINVIYNHGDEVAATPLEKCGLSDVEAKDLKRYLDVTKSQLFFAKRVLFVEGISEALLINEFAKLMNMPLDKYSIEIVNINGVSFTPFAKLFETNDSVDSLKYPCCILTDDDRCTNQDDPNRIKNDELIFSRLDGDSILQRLLHGQISSRAQNLLAFHCDNVQINLSYKTLEYELSVIEGNRPIILDVLKGFHPEHFATIEKMIDDGKSKEIIAIYFWVAIKDCKGEFAQALSRRISNMSDNEQFVVPDYIKNSIEHLVSK